MYRDGRRCGIPGFWRIEATCEKPRKLFFISKWMKDRSVGGHGYLPHPFEIRRRNSIELNTPMRTNWPGSTACYRLARFAIGLCLERNCDAAPPMPPLLDPRISPAETASAVYPVLGQADEPGVSTWHGSRSDARSCGVGVGKCVFATASDRFEPREGTPATDQPGSTIAGLVGALVAFLERGVADRPTRHTHTLASRVVQGGVAAQIEVQSPTPSGDTLHSDDSLDLAVGNRQLPVGRRTDSRGVAQTGHQGE
jgi:hypothetical protein